MNAFSALTEVTKFAAMVAATVAIGGLAATSPAQAQSFVQVRDWDVYVDTPTHFAFVKTPAGWTFVRRLDDEQMSRLPASTLTALLPPEQPEIHWAHPALELSPRVLALRNGSQRVARSAEAVVAR